MPCEHIPAIHTIDRYRGLISAFTVERESWANGFWLRFAAQTAVLSADPPEALAHRIRQCAADLRDQTAWYRSLASPVRFVVAALLVQQNIPVADFLGEQGRMAELFGEVGLRHRGFFETMAVFILRLSPRHQTFSLFEAERVKAIYQQMKHFHWWLTGPNDLPACAALALCPGTAEAVVAQAEHAYQQLRKSGLATGSHLQMAANLLPVTGIEIGDALARYRGLRHCLEERTGLLDQTVYDPLVVLTLLEQGPALIIDRLLAMQDELDLLQPDQRGAVNVLIAADLTFLDLVRPSPGAAPPLQTQEASRMLTAIHAFHIVSAVLLSQIEVNAVQSSTEYDSLVWP
jgi:hypothetical protein